ncbi:GDSL/SGNH-like acyl-esterase family found in Pmr5 and Cas1p-domain-containing protein [Halteromyces radiatus]|uniref:GDSL/SGNH-like acyl-esterase family found in Pmr5 and Cas1p-domain-containing protein n=1 Tax=Halteromyces radiatus TaxID=101107 RepID=UPI00221E5830|nr:GDSL/SGNH-like acyl-esterase family found in Pmr5 and Cas1p-domain-containing protein [Halteromyces radiatus]KAI8086615.1 GDSL/SGNH-like acyl-esterase family found in Pmr5 and Cas1p-domain-containing protein [Halteromyces radiatus]
MQSSYRLTFVYMTTIISLLLLWFYVMPPHDDDPYILPTSIILSNQSSNNKNHHPFISSSQSTDRLCTPHTYNQGKWVRKRIHVKNNSTHSFQLNVNYNCPSHFAHKCFARNDIELQRNKQIAEWQWQPDDCDLLPMDAYPLAKHLSTHPLLFVGDSITQLQYESMSCLLGTFMTTPKTPTNMTGGDKKIKVSELIYSLPKSTDEDDNDNNNSNTIISPSLAYLRSDFLVRVDDFKLIQPFEKEGDLLGVGHNFPWVHALSRFDYIVINTGAHWHTNVRWGPNTTEEELLQGFRDAMTIVFDYLKKVVQPHQRVWIRSTPFGHKNCSRYTKPASLTSPLHPPTGQQGEYEWHLFPVFDAVWREWINDWNQKHTFDTRFAYLDISDMTNLRGDAHSKPDRDCLHTCLPGPVDDWNRLLYHEIGRHSLEQAKLETTKLQQHSS